VALRYKESIDEFLNLLNGKEEPNEDEIFSLVSSLKKVECFINCHNMDQENVWESKSFKFLFLLCDSEKIL
jgi:cohesin complex subunit SA-1/2